MKKPRRPDRRRLREKGITLEDLAVAEARMKPLREGSHGKDTEASGVDRDFTPSGPRDMLESVNHPFGYDIGRRLNCDSLEAWDRFLRHIGDVVIQLDAKVRIVEKAADLYVPLISGNQLSAIAQHRRGLTVRESTLAQIYNGVETPNKTTPLSVTFRGISLEKFGAKGARLDAKFTGDGLHTDRQAIKAAVDQVPGIPATPVSFTNTGLLTLARFSKPVPDNIRSRIFNGIANCGLPELQQPTDLAHLELIDLTEMRYRVGG